MHINVPVTEREKQRIEAEEKFWNGPKLVTLTAVFLGACLCLLYAMANLWDWVGWSSK